MVLTNALCVSRYNLVEQNFILITIKHVKELAYYAFVEKNMDHYFVFEITIKMLIALRQRIKTILNYWNVFS